MSQLYKILTSRNLLKHNGQPLWKYAMDDNEFNGLRKALMETKTLSSIDARDCSLYYAEWWKRCFDGGIPSKKDIFNSISNGQWFDEEMFFQQAKRGANLLGIRWIKNQNTLYFRTLLLQGGLPIKHISNNKGAYKNFLLKILETHPTSIDDFSFDSSITSLLPASSRNDEIYACCLNIVSAILNDDIEYLTLLDSISELKDIASDLRIKKRSLNFGEKKTKYKASWVFEPAKETIRLYLGISEMSSENFRHLFLSNDPNIEPDFEYKLFYNNLILCKFIKKTNNDYKPVWVNQNDINWDGTEQIPELFLTDSLGVKYDCKHLVTYLPNLQKPTLWTKYSDSQWILEKGNHISQEEGFVLFPGDYTSNLTTEIKTLKIGDRPFQWRAFQNTIVLFNQVKRYEFKTNSRKFEWFIADEKPEWIQRSNLPVVQRNPKVWAYDDKRDLIPSLVLKWRQKPSFIWNNWQTPIPRGLIEMQLQVGEIIENDEFFNIGYLDRRVSSATLHEAEVELINNCFQFSIAETDILSIEKTNNDKIRLRLKSNNSLPNAIHASIRINGQSKGLQFEIIPPFKGVEIIDSNNKIVENGTSFNLGNLSGYRLMSNMPNLVINIYNGKRKKIIISSELAENFIPLRNFEEKINQLYSLSDAMDWEAEIILEINQETPRGYTKIKEYKVKRFNQKIDWGFNESNELIIQTNPISAELYAVPLDCKSENLNLLDLENNDGMYYFKSPPLLEKFIIFCSKESDVKVQPAFISLNHENEFTTPEQRVERIINLKDDLLNAAYSEDIWNRFYSYYKICLDNDLSYSTFDILRAAGFSSELATKTFVFLLCQDTTENFATQAHKKMELDLGFSFHWANKNHWEGAMEWIGCFANHELLEIVSSGIKFHYSNLHPGSQFNQTSKYVLEGLKPKIHEGYFLNGKINNLRASLGAKVLSELPQTCPKIPECYKNIITVNAESANVKILLKSPLTVALSIAGKDESLWDRENEYVRRNVKYCYQLNPEWYGEAINYCLTKL
jgi:hypothetical protein